MLQNTFQKHLVLLVLLSIALASGLSTLTSSWAYSCIGDEWSLFDRAKLLVEEGRFLHPEIIFGPLREGVYGVHAPILSAIQSWFMILFGVDNFGWRMSGIIIYVISVFPFYYIASFYLSLRAALVSSCLLLSSYYLYAESMWGYGWSQMRFIALLAFASLIFLSRKPTILSAMFCGISISLCVLIGGLCTYIPICAFLILLILTIRKKLPKKTFGFTILFTLLTSKIPQAIFSEPESFINQLKQTVWKTNLGPLAGKYLGAEWSVGSESTAPADPVEFFKVFINHFWNSITAPITFSGDAHFVIGHLVYPVTGYLICSGMILVAILALKKTKWRIFIFLFFPAILIAGALTPYAILAVTRLHFLVPFWILCAGAIYDYLTRRIPNFVFTLVSAVLIGLNFTWSWEQLTKSVPSNMDYGDCTAGMKVIQDNPDSQIIFVNDLWHPLDIALNAYGYSDRVSFVSDVSNLSKISDQYFKNRVIFFREDRLDNNHSLECTSFQVGRRGNYKLCRKVFK